MNPATFWEHVCGQTPLVYFSVGTSLACIYLLVRCSILQYYREHWKTQALNKNCYNCTQLTGQLRQCQDKVSQLEREKADPRLVLLKSYNDGLQQIPDRLPKS
jgi:hypothetical protein